MPALQGHEPIGPDDQVLPGALGDPGPGKQLCVLRKPKAR